ncbi:MAG: Flp pilus assembly complex ATPase component TadA, partial [Nanoarchaeota archaeon]|nr:Flp pilus assembly complex ATPase component TadA [Nanoarchaeota archaeon]
LNPSGLAFSFRRHRDHPWTFPLYMQPKIRYMDALAAGLLSFLIDNNATILVAGTRSSGKSSLLGSFLIEIMRRVRIITIEDSVTGDSELLIKHKRETKRISIGELIDSSMEMRKIRKSVSGHEVLDLNQEYYVQSMTKSGKIKWAPISKFIRHKVKKELYEITTKTGRKIKVTGDHSLFTLKKTEIIPVSTKSLKEKDFIAVPRVLLNNNKAKKQINIFNFCEDFSKGYVVDEKIIIFLKNKKEKVNDIGTKLGFSRQTINRWVRTGIIPLKAIKTLKIKLSSQAKYKVSPNSQPLPQIFDLDQDFLNFIGLWIADGCYDRVSVIMSVSSREEQDLVKRIAKRFGFETKKHSDKFSLMIHSHTFKTIMKELLGLKGNAFTKRIPRWVFNLSQKQIGWLLKGLFSGDGHAGKQEIIISLSSRKLLEDIQTLLLGFEIILRIGSQHKKDKTYPGRISNLNSWKEFRNKVGFLQAKKNERVKQLCNKKSTHDTTDIIPLEKEILNELKKIKLYYHYNSNNQLGRRKLQQVLFKHKNWLKGNSLRRRLELLAETNIFWDQIKKIRKINPEQSFVYDLSIPETENFITNNIVAHNTFELPQESLRKLGYNLESLKVASALASPGSEVDPSVGIRSTLRLGDSALFVGEVRSKEAVALFEAMRVGAAANVVSGTIHADSPYGVYDRVVNDIGVPKTSFKAIDIIVVTNPVISGLKKYKRVLRITEVRKLWDEDPLKENAFVDLMVYNPVTDQMEVTDELRNGNSEIMKRMAGRIKEFAGDWDAVWNNVVLRADVKQAVLDISLEKENPDLLEAEFVILANDQFHLIIESVKDETGKLDNERILFEFKEWLRKEVHKKKM